MKRSLGSHGGDVIARGPDADLLKTAFAAAAEYHYDELTHGFHSYPARMHAHIARTLLPAVGGKVFDPFVGSGTVAIESMLQGRAFVGTDLNPVAIMVAKTKTARSTAESRALFAKRAGAVVDASKDRVRAKSSQMAPIPKHQVRLFDGHVLRELAGLHAEILAVDDDAQRHHMLVVLSSILIKFSRVRSETAADQEGQRRIGRFIPSEFFGKKCAELCDRWEAFEDELPNEVPTPKLRELDILRTKVKNAAVIITSPPYGGTYDYVDHHKLRAPWLSLSLEKMRRFELGARRRFSRPKSQQEARRSWDGQVRAFLAVVHRSLAPGGVAFLLMGDGQIGDERVDAEAQLAKIGAKLGLPLRSAAYEVRRDFHKGSQPRREYLLVMEKNT